MAPDVRKAAYPETQLLISLSLVQKTLKFGFENIFFIY